jgi:hypothetical protein
MKSDHLELAHSIARLALDAVDDQLWICVGAIACMASAVAETRGEAAELLASVGRQIVDFADEIAASERGAS